MKLLIAGALILGAFMVNSNEMASVELCSGTPEQCAKF